MKDSRITSFIHLTDLSELNFSFQAKCHFNRAEKIRDQQKNRMLYYGNIARQEKRKLAEL